MVNEITKLQILAVHAAVVENIPLRDSLISSVQGDAEHHALEHAWRSINATACLRQLARGKKENAPTLDLSQFEQRGDTFFWQGQEIGKLLTLYKPPLPEEWQARIAYESFLDRFAIHLQSQEQILLVADNDYYQGFFCWKHLNISATWQGFLQQAFSTTELIKTFVALLNSVRLAENGGFSVLQVPIISKAQAKLLAGFYLASMNARAKGLKQLEIQIAEAKNKGNIEKAAEKAAKLDESLENQRARYQDSIDAMSSLRQEYGEDFNEIVQHASLYTPTARSQLKVTGPVVKKFVSETKRLLNLTPDDYYLLPSLLSADSGMLLTSRNAGDNPKETCYVCGRLIEDGGFEANKVILPSPSQTLQSKSNKESPMVCGTCSALAVASPIKFANQTLVIRLLDRTTQNYLLEDQLRMFVLGELSVYAGRYVMLTSTEKIGKDSLIKEFSKEPYALWKVATMFPADVFRAYLIEAIIDGAQVILPGRYLAWLSALTDIFYEVKTPYRLENDKSKLTAVKKSLRHIQHEEVIFAIYELTKAFMADRDGGFNPIQATRLEDLRALHVWWLENNFIEETERRSRMGDLMNKARSFRDVAGMTGILYAFANYIKSVMNEKVSRGEARKEDVEREVEKLLEKVDEPNHFLYDAAGELPDVGARLYFQPSTHFIYEQAKELLQEIGVEVRETAENGKSFLQFFFDDISATYTYLSETRYKTEKDWREFTYQVKLSLYARFPEYLRKKNKEA